METEFRMFWREEDGMWSNKYSTLPENASGARPSIDTLDVSVRNKMVDLFGVMETIHTPHADLVSLRNGKEVRFMGRDREGVQLFISVKVMDFHKPLPTIEEELKELLSPVGDVVVIPLTLEEYNKIVGADKEVPFPKEFGDVPVPTKFNFVVSAFLPNGTLRTKEAIDQDILDHYGKHVGHSVLGAKYRILAELGNAYKSNNFMAIMLGECGRGGEAMGILRKNAAIDELAREYSTELFGKEM